MNDKQSAPMPDKVPTEKLSGALAEMVVPSIGIASDMPFFIKTLGFRLDKIFPADDPTVAILSGHGVRIRLDATDESDRVPPDLRLLVADPDSIAGGNRQITAPNGMRIFLDERDPPLVTPTTQHSYIVRRLADAAPWVIGRAGMHYRDLIPDRLGGSIIASHIRIPDGGPVPDMVHYHTVGFQLIFCIAGWVDLVYEDQGPQFRLHAGDCVIQPPEIRHRVLFASENIEVVEIGVPAEHVTTIDHDMELPNGPARPDRRFQGQRFVHHQASEAKWSDWRLPGFVARDTDIGDGTNGVAGVHVVKWQGGDSVVATHDCDILFDFVMTGRMTLSVEGEADFQLSAGDAFVVPPGRNARFHECSDDLELMEVVLPSAFATTIAKP
jgi:quercetin dioxygenase-like cupin family protein